MTVDEMPGFPTTTRYGYRLLGVENGCLIRTMTLEEMEYVRRRCYEAVCRLSHPAEPTP